MEILQMIAEYLATPDQLETHAPMLSTHLFKMRAICKSFNSAATFVFLKRTEVQGSEEYKTLHLPCSLDLKALEKSAKEETNLMSRLVTKIEYHIMSSQSDTVDDVECIAECMFENVAHTECCSGDCTADLVSEKLLQFADQRRKHDDFASKLASVTGRRSLREILVNLPHLNISRVEIKDFWEGAQNYEWSPESDHVARHAYEKGIPAFIECLSGSKVGDVEFHGLGAYALRGLNPLAKIKLLRKKNFLMNVTTLKLSLSHRDDADFPDYGDVRLRGLARADRLALLLHSMKSLQSLALSCHEDVKLDSVELDSDCQWLEDLLKDQHWTSLTVFELREFHSGAEALEHFLRRHLKTLRNVTMAELVMPDADWLTLLTLMRVELRLNTACLQTSKQHHVPELIAIVDAYDTKKGTAPGAKIDIGKYVIRADNEVIELD
jgi:hypothetical protein